MGALTLARSRSDELLGGWGAYAGTLRRPEEALTRLKVLEDAEENSTRSHPRSSAIRVGCFDAEMSLLQW